MTSNADLWNKAREVIVGGCGLLSKRPTRYCSSAWPSYFVDSQGCKIKAINGNWYRDFTEFSIGCNILGYKHPQHLRSIPKSVLTTPLSSLLSPYEPELAIRLNDFLGTVYSWKFCRGGGEALALCIRYARSVAKNTRVLVCGYHGWHDWYLSANIRDSEDFSRIFLPGLNVLGIPEGYSQYAYAVSPDDVGSFVEVINNYRPGVIIFESARYELLDSNIVRELKKFQANGGIIVSDEVTSGLRFSSKLACYSLGLSPDFFVLGKALGNGFAISAVALKKVYHSNCEDCFASSTHWTEQIGLAAGCATINVVSDWDASFSMISCHGDLIRDSILSALHHSSLDFSINSLSTMISFSMYHKLVSSQQIKALVSRRMVLKGFLFSTTIYPSLAHTPRHIAKYKKALHETLKEVSCLLNQNTIELKHELELIGPIEQGFNRTQAL